MNGITLDKTIRAGNVQLGRGNIISSEDIAKYPGDYPIYSSSAKGSGEFGRYGHYMFDEELITWSVDGGGRFFSDQSTSFQLLMSAATCMSMERSGIVGSFITLSTFSTKE